MPTLKELFGSECKFIAGAASIEQIPKNTCVPEVAFVGRSNVGKSSLINAITGKICARVSKQPGRTQQINFFSLQNKVYLADLPGYGYAAVSKKTRKDWNSLILDYLRGRQNLRRIFMLIDSRHGIKDNDRQIMKILDDSAVVYQIVLTKVDKIGSSTDVVRQVQTEISQHTAAFEKIILTSSEEGMGIRDVQNEIISFT